MVQPNSEFAKVVVTYISTSDSPAVLGVLQFLYADDKSIVESILYMQLPSTMAVRC